jgi:hypothetical protein
MYGVIFFWRVKPDRLAEHEPVLKGVLRIGRPRLVGRTSTRTARIRILC